MSGDTGAIALAERVLAVLDQGSFSATYKYALFMAILDLTIEKTTAGGPPTSITTRELAEEIVELYWPHASPYEPVGRVLRQGGGHVDHQAEIVGAIARFRQEVAGAPEELHFRARLARPAAYERLVRFVEWKLIEMPIPRLQVMGRDEDRFLYEYSWDQSIKRAPVSAYQAGTPGAFDNRLLLRPGVAENLVRLNGVLRPILQREWAVMVASMNGLPEATLETFLFGAERIPLDPVRQPLRELQSNRCFYCEGRIEGACEVDHFIPWARYPDNGLDNLVAAHGRCNSNKRDFLAAADHLERWRQRGRDHGDVLAALGVRLSWDRNSNRSRGVASALYGRLPAGARLWSSGSDFEVAEVDHFIPWARYPDNGLDNLVAAHGRCNSNKRDFLAAADHLERWRQRGRDHGEVLAALGVRLRWDRNSDRSRGVASALYGRLPAGARLWSSGSDFEVADPARLKLALSA